MCRPDSRSEKMQEWAEVSLCALTAPLTLWTKPPRACEKRWAGQCATYKHLTLVLEPCSHYALTRTTIIKFGDLCRKVTGIPPYDKYRWIEWMNWDLFEWNITWDIKYSCCAMIQWELFTRSGTFSTMLLIGILMCKTVSRLLLSSA